MCPSIAVLYCVWCSKHSKITAMCEVSILIFGFWNMAICSLNWRYEKSDGRNFWTHKWGQKTKRKRILTDVLLSKGRVSSVGIATRYGLEGPGIESRWEARVSDPSRSAVGPTQTPVKWVRVFPGSEVAAAWRWPLPLHLTQRLKKKLSYTSNPPLRLCGLF